MIPFINLQKQQKFYEKELLEAEKSVIESGCFIGGPQVQALERVLSERTGREAITCGSGTEAITIALMALGLSPNDEVIVPDFTFIAPAECVAFLGGRPKFADIDIQTLQISPESVEKLITPRTRGIIAVNLFGQCAPFEKLRDIAKKYGLWIIEDSAQAFGALRNSKPACSFGDISITSFYPTKPLGCCGDGGALFTHDEALAQRARMIANHGSRGHYKHEILGVNSRLDAMQAAILNIKLKHFDDELKIRENNARKYDEFFRSIAGIQPQVIDKNNTSTYAQYTVLADNREQFIKVLEKAEIPYCIHYPSPLSHQKCFAPCDANNRNAQEASLKAISLPVCAFTNVEEIIARLNF